MIQCLSISMIQLHAKYIKIRCQNFDGTDPGHEFCFFDAALRPETSAKRPKLQGAPRSKLRKLRAPVGMERPIILEKWKKSTVTYTQFHCLHIAGGYPKLELQHSLDN